MNAITNNQIKNNRKLKAAVLATAAAMTGLIAMPRYTNAALVTLSNGNSTITLDAASNEATPTSQDGVNSWTIDSPSNNVATEQWFWLKAGTAPAERLSSLTLTGDTVVDTTGGNNPNYVSLSYAGQGLQVTASYTLTGGTQGSGFSDLLETVVATNVSGNTLNLRMADYTDLNVSPNDSLSIYNGGNTVSQVGTAIINALATASPSPSEYEAATAADDLIGGLDSGTAFPLNDASVVMATGSTDADDALEYDKNLVNGGSLVFTVNQEVGQGILPDHIGIPEPTSASLLAAASSLFLMRPRRRDEDPDPRTAQVAGA